MPPAKGLPRLQADLASWIATSILCFDRSPHRRKYEETLVTRVMKCSGCLRRASVTEAK